MWLLWYNQCVEFENFINNSDKITSQEALNKNVLVFAFVGDAVFTLYVRELFATLSNKKAGVLHTETSHYVKASYQAKLLGILEPLLTERELQIVRSARNIKTHNIAKNSNLDEYKKATSFESLLGELYMTNNNERLMQLLEICKQNILISEGENK